MSELEELRANATWTWATIPLQKRRCGVEYTFLAWRLSQYGNDFPLPREACFGEVMLFRDTYSWPGDLSDEDQKIWADVYQCKVSFGGDTCDRHSRYVAGRPSADPYYLSEEEKVRVDDLSAAKSVVEAAMRRSGIIRPRDIIVEMEP